MNGSRCGLDVICIWEAGTAAGALRVRVLIGGVNDVSRKVTAVARPGDREIASLFRAEGIGLGIVLELEEGIGLWLGAANLWGWGS